MRILGMQSKFVVVLFAEVDGVFTTKSLLLKEPRLHMRFNSVEVIREEQRQQPARPPTFVLVCRCLLFCLSCGALITGLVLRQATSGFGFPSS